MDGLAAFNLDSSDGPVTGENAEDGIVQGKEVQRLVAVSRALTSEVDSINSSLKSFDGLTESGNKLIEANKSAEQQVVDLLKSNNSLNLSFSSAAYKIDSNCKLSWRFFSLRSWFSSFTIASDLISTIGEDKNETKSDENPLITLISSSLRLKSNDIDKRNVKAKTKWSLFLIINNKRLRMNNR